VTGQVAGKVFVAAVVLAVIAGASGSPAGAIVKRSGGVTYAYKRTSVDAGFNKVKVRCPRGTHVVGGGEANGFTFNGLALHHSYPIDGHDRGRKPDDGWETVVNAAGSNSFEPYAICVERRVTYVKRTLAADSLDQTNHVIGCPNGLRVVMGGHRGSNQLSMNSGFATGEGWALFIENSTNGPLTFKGFATCVRFGISREIEPDNSFEAGQGFVEAPCPPGRHVVGGGLSNGFGYGQARVNSSFPASALDPTREIGRHWSAWVDNFAGTGSVTAQAVCAGSLR
jgi:hypothetical protein